MEMRKPGLSQETLEMAKRLMPHASDDLAAEMRKLLEMDGERKARLATAEIVRT